MIDQPQVGDMVRNKRQPFLAGHVTRRKFSLFEVRLDTGGLTMWTYNEYEPVIAHYYEDAANTLFRLDIDPDTVHIMGCWMMVRGHWERAAAGTAHELEFSGDYRMTSEPRVSA